MKTVRHIVVAKAASSVRFAPSETFICDQVPSGNLRARVIVQTRYSCEGFSKPVPRELWIEASCSAPSFDQAIVDLTNAGGRVLPAIAFCANAPIDDPEPELAFEIADEGNEHQLFQRHVTREWGFPRARRRAPHGAITSFLNSWLAHPDAERIYRALVQYSIALRYGAAGREILAHAHFYMAVESLTKALLRDECNRTKMTDDQLAQSWTIDKKQLDGEIRLKRVFNGDKLVYKAAKEASDGLEHGFANFDIIRSQAEAAVQKTAACVRVAIFDLVGLPASARAVLTQHPYGEPLDPRPFEQVVRGTLIGAPGDLAHKMQAYPCIRWSFELADYLGEDEEGRMQFRPKDVVMTPLIGTGAGFQLSSFEVRLPDKHGKVSPIKGAATVRLPKEILQDTRHQIEEIRVATPGVVETIAREQLREFANLLGKRSAKPTRRDAVQLQKKLANLQKRILPHHIALAALSGQLPINVARYILLERATSETLTASGIRSAAQQDAFEVLIAKMEKGLNESRVLRRQAAYANVTGLRAALIAHLAASEHEIALKPVLDHWYESGEYKKIVRYAGQYRAKASRFIFARPARYNQRTVIRLTEQYGHHAGLLQQQLRFLLALDHSARGEKRMYSDIEEKNLDSLLGSPKTHESIRTLAQVLDRRIRNALAHGVPEIDCANQLCVFEDRNKRVELTFDELFDRTMLLTVTTLCLLGIEQRLQSQWLRGRLNALLGG